MALVSVILPTRDRSHLLSRAVTSVLGQTERDFELLIIDNNCREPPVVEQDGAGWNADQRVTVLRPARVLNAAVARNTGLDAARGHWVTYLDDDDVYRPTKIARQLALARETQAPLVLCGAEFHLHGRTRVVQSERTEWRRDDLILRARWNTPLLFHRHPGALRFDERLSPGEDAEFAQRLLARAASAVVPVVAEALVDIFPQSTERVNTNPAPLRPSAARILALRPAFFSRRARRRYVLQTLLAVAKLRQQRTECVRLSWRLLIESSGADWRACANALAASCRILPGRWVS